MAERPLADLVHLLRERGALVATGPDAPTGAVTTVAYDSRRVTPGGIFAALRGQHADGHEHVAAAVAAGAVAVLVERPVEVAGVAQLIVRDGRAALAVAAAWLEGFPSHRLGIVGLTGTDGKTTTAYLVRAVLAAASRPTGLIGTIDVVVGGRSLGNAARATTPEAPELQAALGAMASAGDAWAVVESTSHGLAQRRVDEVAYDVAVLTNITQEHLEFHGTPAAYRAAKRGLFERLAVSASNPEKGYGKHAVVNADDPAGLEMAAAARAAGAGVVRYASRAPTTAAGAGRGLAEGDADGPEVVADTLDDAPDALRIAMRTPAWSGEVRLRLAGRFNVHNALAAMGVAHVLGIDGPTAARGLESLAAVPGRMERIDLGQPFSVIVDYAHTAEALAKVLDELAPPPGSEGGRIAVFGSAGERDVAKRPAMGRVAGERCRLVVVTDEDPRREDRGAILDAIARGAEAAGRRRGDDLLVIPDRAEAIEEAIARARPGDRVLLAGKGHERTIETADGPIAWHEAGAATEALRRLGYGEDRPAGTP